MPIRIAIVDDEPAARGSLCGLLRMHCPDALLVGEAGGVAEAMVLLQRAPVDLLLLDVEMEDGTGFDLLDRLAPIAFKVVFTTAYDAFAIRAFRYHAIDYLLKPIDPDELNGALSRAVQALPGQALLQQQIANLLHTAVHRTFDRIALETDTGLVFATASDITRIESYGNFSFVFLSDGERCLVSRNLKAFEEMLSPAGFFRPHQSHIVNMAFVKAFLKDEGGQLLMRDGARVPVARRKKDAFLKVLCA